MSAIISYVTDVIDTRVKYTGKGDQIHFNCPFCGDRRKRMYIGVFNHLVFCQNCNYSGTVVKFLSDYEGITYDKAFSLYKEYNGVLKIPENVTEEINDILLPVDYEQYLRKSPIPLPESFTLLHNNNSVYSKRVKRYLKSRLVTNSVIKSHGWGFCYEGNYKDRAILTIYEENKLKFWVARAITDNAVRKELSPSDEDYQYSKSEVIFNVDRAAKMYNTVVVSEGIFDAISWGDIGVSILGKRMYPEQISVLLKYKEYLTQGVYLALDEDAWRDMLELADNLYKYMPVYLVRVKDDPNYHARKYGKDSLLSLLDSAVEYTPLFKVRGKLLF